MTDMYDYIYVTVGLMCHFTKYEQIFKRKLKDVDKDCFFKRISKNKYENRNSTALVVCGGCHDIFDFTSIRIK